MSTDPGWMVDDYVPIDDRREFLTRARAWQAHHDPDAVRDPDSAGSIDWAPDPNAAQDYRHCPRGYRKVFSAFTMTARPPAATDWITWHHR